MSMDQPRRPTRTPGGPARPSRSASPAIAVAVAIVAAVVGFVILRAVGNDSSSTSSGSPTATTPKANGATTTAAPTVPTTPAPTINRSAFKVLVANASGIKGSAGGLTTQLKALGFTTLDPTNSKDTALKLTTTAVYFNAGSEAAAADVAGALKLGPAQALPNPLPVTEASWVGGNVLVMLGTDLAGKDIPGAAAAPSVTAAASPNSTGAATATTVKKTTTTVKKVTTTAKK